MSKAIRGIYGNGQIKLPLKELPETKEELPIIVIFLEEDNNIQQTEEEVKKIDLAPSIDSQKESPKEKEVFSLADTNFFSLPSEHLGRTSAEELDKIIAK
jgi:PII-like signaling protein